jgi:mono/diheme cytochrome c family protein
MSHKQPRLRLLIAAATLIFASQTPSAAANTKEGATIEIWTRASGDAGDQGSPHARSRQVDLDRMRLEHVQRYDAQYARDGRYRGAPLQVLLAQYAPDVSLDLAILHFANGMAVPIPFRDQVTMRRLAPFVARGSKFPALPKKDAPFDRRPIEFSGNKLVVADRWHPDVLSETQSEFSPWTHVDTLTGIELVATVPYYAQFEVAGGAGVGRGGALFRQNCQFCHGVHQIGATFGWDFVDSPAISNYEDSPENLYHNVAFKPRNASEIGLMMPPLTFLSQAAANDVLQWLEAINKVPRPPYRRPPAAEARPAP